MRPRSIVEIADRAVTGGGGFDEAVREFLDVWQSLDIQAKRESISGEPCHVGRVQDAYLAALAEHLSAADVIEPPVWTENAHRFLTRPYFAGGLESLKAILLVESPPAFRRRLIFISRDALSRPRREFIQGNALNVSNLDV